MRDFLKRRVGWPSVGWLWVLALLALPDCSLETGGLGTFTPATTAVFCDIQKPLTEGGRHCASPDEIDMGIRQASAAVALNTGQTMTITLDESAGALAACAGTTGGPQAVVFQGPFPQGQPGCVDPTGFTDPNAFCVAMCNGLISDVTFCNSNAHASTNVPLTGPPGFPGGCTSEGVLRPDFDDPRKVPEPVVWGDLIGTSAGGNNLTRTAATTGGATSDFNAGAVSTQWFSHGDGYVEFSASEANKSHVAGLSEIGGGCPPPCTDADASLTDINFGISLNKDGRFYVIEGGSLVTGPDLNGSFGTFNAGERYRVSLRQSSDGSATATVTYSRLTASCVPGNPCPETVFYTHAGVGHYPLRVDASFREQGATLSDVRVVRIQ